MKVSIGPYRNYGKFRIVNWIKSKFKRKIKIKIDDYDVWNMDHTLALIILPMLKKLKGTKHGAPLVDNEDVSENLHRDQNLLPEQIDDFHFDRWNYVMDEMIFSFEHIVDDSWEDEFFQGNKFNKDEYEQISKRIQRGLILFGKYYQSLWD